MPAPDRVTAQLWRWRAATAWTAMNRTFAVEDTGLYRERYGVNAKFDVAFLWPMTQVFGSATDLASLSPPLASRADVRTVTDALAGYRDDSREPPGFSSYLAPPVGWLSDRYYDDNVWLGVELVRSYDITHDPDALKYADEIFDFLISGWDTEGPDEGGIYWIESDSNHDRNTVTTGTAALLGLMLHDRLSDEARRIEVLDWSARMYAWVYEYLADEDGIFRDHVRDDGSIDYAVYSYNQGAMIGANLWFHRLTGDALFLDRATRTAQAVLALEDGRYFEGQEIAFNAIFFHYLLDLDQIRPDPAYRQALLRYADYIWNERRDPESGLATTSMPLTLLDQAAMVRLLALAAAASE